MGLREVILLLIVLVAAFVAYQLYRIARARKAAKALPAEGPTRAAPQASFVADSADEEDEEDDEVLVFERPVVRAPDDTARAPGTPDPKLFELELEIRQLRRELEQQRAESATLRQSVEELGATLRAQKAQSATTVVRQVGSPEYDEALVYARRGLGVEAIAERCGITVAEAALVCSLARGRSDEGGTTP